MHLIWSVVAVKKRHQPWKQHGHARTGCLVKNEACVVKALVINGAFMEHSDKKQVQKLFVFISAGFSYISIRTI